MSNHYTKEIKKIKNIVGKATLFIIQGLPGSGKSTFGRELSNYLRIPKFEADDFFMKSGKYIFDPSKLRFAHEKCKSDTMNALKKYGSAIVANTFTSNKEIKPYIDMANELHIKVILIKMSNNYGSVHNVPDEAIERMRSRFESCTFKPDMII